MITEKIMMKNGKTTKIYEITLSIFTLMNFLIEQENDKEKFAITLENYKDAKNFEKELYESLTRAEKIALYKELSIITPLSDKNEKLIYERIRRNIYLRVYNFEELCKPNINIYSKDDNNKTFKLTQDQMKQFHPEIVEEIMMIRETLLEEQYSFNEEMIYTEGDIKSVYLAFIQTYMESEAFYQYRSELLKEKYQIIFSRPELEDAFIQDDFYVDNTFFSYRGFINQFKGTERNLYVEEWVIKVLEIKINNFLNIIDSEIDNYNRINILFLKWEIQALFTVLDNDLRKVFAKRFNKFYLKNFNEDGSFNDSCDIKIALMLLEDIFKDSYKNKQKNKAKGKRS